MPLGPVEIVVLVILLTLLFGTARVASLARAAGSGVREVKQPLAEAKAIFSLDAPAAEAPRAEEDAPETTAERPGPAEPPGRAGDEPPASPRPRRVTRDA